MAELIRILKADLYTHNKLMGLTGFLKGWFLPGFRYTVLLRLVSMGAKNTPWRWFFQYLKRRYRFKYGFEIDKDAKIGEGFHLTDHCGPVIIGPIKMGSYCHVGHSVTIGRAFINGKSVRPEISDHVHIGSGSVLVGKIKIGSNVVIAPNSYVNQDVPDNSFAVGNPVRIFPRENEMQSIETLKNNLFFQKANSN